MFQGKFSHLERRKFRAICFVSSIVLICSTLFLCFDLRAQIWVLCWVKVSFLFSQKSFIKQCTTLRDVIDFFESSSLHCISQIFFGAIYASLFQLYIVQEITKLSYFETIVCSVRVMRAGIPWERKKCYFRYCL